MAEAKAEALTQAYKLKLIFKDEARPHFYGEHSSIVLDLTPLLKEKGMVSDNEKGGLGDRIIGIQEIFHEDAPDGLIRPMCANSEMSWTLKDEIIDIVRASIVNEKQYEAISKLIENMCYKHYRIMEDRCRDVVYLDLHKDM